MIKQITFLKVVLIPLSVIFVFSTYKAYHEYSLSQYLFQNPTSISLISTSSSLFVGEVFDLDFQFKSIPEYSLNEENLIALFNSLCKDCKVVDYKVYRHYKKEIADKTLSSFYLKIKSIADKPITSFNIEDYFLKNDLGDKFYLTGFFPTIKELGTYSIHSPPQTIIEGDYFEIQLLLENVELISQPQALIFKDKNSLKAPNKIGKYSVDIRRGLRGTDNIKLTQKYQAQNAGDFNSEPLEFTLKDKKIVVNPFSVSVAKLIRNYEVKFDPPPSVDDRFFISVKTSNVSFNNRTPIFPNIVDCKKEDLKIDKEKINEQRYTITYTQFYTVTYDGTYTPDNLIVYLGSERHEKKLIPFQIDFDCSSVNKSRLPNGYEPLKLSGKKYGSKNDIKISNKHTEDIFVKVINYSNNKAVRSIYIWGEFSATVRDLASGTYYLAVAYGSHWDKKYNRFRCNKYFAIFDKYNDLMTFNSWESGSWEMTLYEIRTSNRSNGLRTVNEATFEKY